MYAQAAESNRTRLEMKEAETAVHLRCEEPARMKRMIPDHIWALPFPDGLRPRPGERREDL